LLSKDFENYCQDTFTISGESLKGIFLKYLPLRREYKVIDLSEDPLAIRSSSSFKSKHVILPKCPYSLCFNCSVDDLRLLGDKELISF
jgi:hypothetical protein